MTEETTPPRSGVPIWAYVLTIIFTIILTAAIAGGSVYLWQQLNLQKLQTDMQSLQQQLDQTKRMIRPPAATTQPPIPTPSPSPTPVAATVKADFITAIQNKDLATISTLLSDRIDYTKFETSCCGLITHDDTMQYLQFINTPATYNFSPDQEAVTNIKTVLPKYEDFTIGIGSDKTVLGFRTSSHSQKVDAILQATTYEAFEITTP